MRRSLLATSASAVAFVIVAASGAGAQTADRNSIGGSAGSGARAQGMGGAFIAIADDATAASWNPAGLGQLRRPEASVTFTVTDYSQEGHNYEWLRRYLQGTTPSSTYLFTDTKYAADPYADIEFASFTYPITAGTWAIVPQFSIQRSVRLRESQTFSYDESWTRPDGRATGVYDQSDSVTAGAMNVYTLSVGVGKGSRFSFGASVNMWRGSPSLARTSSFKGVTSSYLYFYESNRDTQATDSFEGMNAVAGALFSPARWIRLGAVYRSTFSLTNDYTWDVHSTSPNYGPNNYSYSETGTDSITWPQSFGVGVALFPTDRLTISSDFTWNQWSKGKRTTSYTYKYSDEPRSYSGTETYFWPGGQDPEEPSDPAYNPYQQDTTQLRVGAEYLIRGAGTGSFVGIPIRGGAYSTDVVGIMDRPDGSQVAALGFSVGGGLVYRQVSIDFAYVREAFDHTFWQRPTKTYSTYSDTFSQPTPAQNRRNRFFVSTVFRF